MSEKIYKPIPRFNDHGSCKGHANTMLDMTYETQEERDLLDRVIEHYRLQYEANSQKT